MVSLKGLAWAIKMGGHGVLVECGCVELAETNELGGTYINSRPGGVGQI